MSVKSQRAHTRIASGLAADARLSASVVEHMRRSLSEGRLLRPSEMGHAYERGLHRETRRQQGSYFTPEYLVDLCVEEVLRPRLAEASIDDILRFRICDPSCGGGAFLLGALRWLLAHAQRLGEPDTLSLRTRLSACLLGVDIDEAALATCSAALSLAIGGEHRAQLVCSDALLPRREWEAEVGAIDFIVGNPPWGQKGLRIDADKKRRYKELFTCAVGVWDPCKLFVERSLQLLEAGGRWGLVLPDIVLLKNLQEVRDCILDRSALSCIAHCGRAFEGVNLDAVVIAGRVGTTKPGERLRVIPKVEVGETASSSTSYWQAQEVYRELPGHAFNLAMHGEALALYRRLRDLPRLGEHFEMHEGVHSGNSRSKLFLDAPRAASCQKLVLGRQELSAFRLSWQGRWLDTDPGVLDRAGGDYANLGRPEWHRANKIVVRRTGDRVIAAFDEHGYYVSNNMFVLAPLSCSRGDAMGVEERQAVVALLNSRLMTWYFRTIVPRVGRLFAELKLVHLRDFPLPEAARWKRLWPRLAVLASEAQHAAEHEEGNELARLRTRIDQMVESAYQISPDEAEMIRISQCIPARGSRGGES